MALSPDLKPCPFCGGVAELIPVRKNDYYYQCSRCAAAAQPADTAEEAVIPWNRRPPSPPEDELSKPSGGWEPIETAKKTRGEFVLLYTPEYGGRIAFAAWQGPDDEAEWYGVDSNGVTFSSWAHHEQPTHWHPLPALPQDHATVRGREGSVDRQTSSSTQCADAQARPTGGDS